MKRNIGSIISLFVIAIVLGACTPPYVPTDNAPVILGADNITITRGSTFIPLQGVTATDVEDGDLTASITYSGNVNPNIAGVYQANYAVIDSDGNLTTKARTITVVIVDTEAPLLSGVANVNLIVGDPTFTVMGGVAANDTIDGDLTAQIQVTGSVNVWAEGEYTLVYTVKDVANNTATRTRVVNVSLGNFTFAEDSSLTNGSFTTDATNWTASNATTSVASGVVTITPTAEATFSQSAISGGVINLDIANYGLAKLVFRAKADATRNINVSLTNALTQTTPIILTDLFQEYTLYFRIGAELTDSTLEFDLGNAGTFDFDSVELYFGEIEDNQAPVLTVPETMVVVPLNNADALRALLLRGVSALDDIDGNITASIAIDLTDVNLGQTGEQTITIRVSDKAGNEATATRKANFHMAFDTNAITDHSFDGALDATQWGLSGGGTEVTMYTQDGKLVVDVVNPGGWDSATSPFLRGIDTTKLVSGAYYMFQFDVHAEKTRQMRIRSGMELYTDPWIEDFADVKNLQYVITPTVQTIYYVFYVDKATSADGSANIKFEIKLGTITWGGEEKNNKIFIDNAQFYLLSLVDQDPVITVKEGIKTTYATGDPLPDFTTFFLVNDMEDGAITVTLSMIDSSTVNMNAAGTYQVLISVTDSGGNTATSFVAINVIEVADTTPPVLTEIFILPTTFDQFASVVVDLKAYITATDDVDGEITITNAMVDAGGFDLTKAGTFTVIYTVTDSSGNESTLSILFTINDKQAPVFSGLSNRSFELGATWDPLLGVTATDNIDGAIALTKDNIGGLDEFLDVNNQIHTAGEFTVTYTVIDAAGNIKTQTIDISVVDLVFNEDNPVNLLGLNLPVNNDGETTEATALYNVDGSATITYTGTVGWYGSYSKLRYTSVPLVKDEMYKLVIEAKAETARDILLRLVGGDGTTAVSAFAGRMKLGLETDYQTFEIIFKADQTGPFDLQVQFGWESNLNNAQNANVIDIKQIKILSVFKLEFDTENPIDFIAMQNPVNNDGGTIESSAVYNVDETVTVTYNGPVGWYGSYSKFKYLNVPLIKDQTYKLVIEAKAETARDILVRFVGGDGTTHLSAFEGRLKVSIAQEYNVFELVFVADKTGPFSMEVQFGWEDFLSGATASNVIDFKQIRILRPAGFEEKIFLIDDFEDYADQAAMEAVYWHRVPNATTANHNDEHLTLGADYGSFGSKGAKLIFGAHGVMGWDLMRTKANFDASGLTDEYQYFAFFFKGDETVTNVRVWLYWVGSQNNVTVDVSHLPAEGGYVSVPLTSWGKTATQIIQYAFGYDMVNTTTTGHIFIDDVMFITSPAALEQRTPPVKTTILFDDFESYTDEAGFHANYWHRVSGSSHNDSHVTFSSYQGLNGSKAMKVQFGEHGVTGWDLARLKNNLSHPDLNDEYVYFGFWIKPDLAITEIYVWMYWSTSQDSRVISLASVPVEGGFVYIPLSSWSKTATQITQFAIAYNMPNTTMKATVYIDNIMFLKSLPSA